jgi:hypothetical protein
MEGLPKEQFDSPEDKKEVVKQLFGHCFEVATLENNDPIPVGGESIFSEKVDTTIGGDFEKFQDFFKEVQQVAASYDLVEMRQWLDSQNIKVDERLFAKLVAFTKKLDKTYPDNPDRAATRRKIYGEKGLELKLSDIFDANAAECAEIAALAQFYLQQEGIPSSYFSGDVLWNEEQEFSDEHSFVIIRQGDKLYIYDPANPTATNYGKFPSLYTTETSFDEEVNKGRKIFVSSRNILSKKEAFFGVNDMTSVSPEDIIKK